MQQHDYTISGKVQVELQRVCSCLDGSFNGTECIFGEMALVASVGDRLGKPWGVDGRWRVEEVCWRSQRGLTR